MTGALRRQRRVGHAGAGCGLTGGHHGRRGVGGNGQQLPDRRLHELSGQVDLIDARIGDRSRRVQQCSEWKRKCRLVPLTLAALHLRGAGHGGNLRARPPLNKWPRLSTVTCSGNSTVPRSSCRISAKTGRRARGMVRGLGRRSGRYSVRHDVRFALLDTTRRLRLAGFETRDSVSLSGLRHCTAIAPKVLGGLLGDGMPISAADAEGWRAALAPMGSTSASKSAPHQRRLSRVARRDSST